MLKVGDLLTVKEMAEALKVSEQTIRKWVKEERIPKPIRVGQKMLWRRETLEKLLSEQE